MSELLAAGRPPFSTAPLWYLTRSTGITAFILLTIALAFGVAATQRAMASRAWPRWATQAVHRNVALIALPLLVLHIITTAVDEYVDVSWISVVVPFTSGYERVWVGLGAIAFVLIVLVVLTSLVRLRLPQRLWLVIHLSVYIAWLLSLVHFVRVGTDVKDGQYGLWIAVACSALVGAAVGIRVVTSFKSVRTVSTPTSTFQ